MSFLTDFTPPTPHVTATAFEGFNADLGGAQGRFIQYGRVQRGGDAKNKLRRETWVASQP
jgi:hypothetical protein